MQGPKNKKTKLFLLKKKKENGAFQITWVAAG